jgi:hypothetical protein
MPNHEPTHISAHAQVASQLYIKARCTVTGTGHDDQIADVCVTVPPFDLPYGRFQGLPAQLVSGYLVGCHASAGGGHLGIIAE